MTSAIDHMLHDAEISPEFEDKREEMLIASVINGEDCDNFLRSPVGEWVLGSARQEQQELEEAIMRVAPWRKRKIQRMQMRHQAIAMAVGWLCEAVSDGQEAISVLSEPKE